MPGFINKLKTINKINQFRIEIMKEMSLYSIEKGCTLFEQGASGNFFYIVKEGELGLFVNKKRIKSIKHGESFGEMALLHNCARSATIRAETLVKVWSMERKSFRKIIDHINGLNHQDNKKYIASIPFLSNNF